MEKMKRCGCCGQFKSITEFYIDRSKHDGLCSYCKTCRYQKVNCLAYMKNIRRDYYEGFMLVL